MEVPQFGKGKKSNHFLLVDEYSLFYLTWGSGVSSVDLQTKEPDYWVKQRNTQAWQSWSGFSFEIICLKHIENIKTHLGLGAVNTSSSRWKSDGAEIDLVIDRKDQCINLCEIKFYDAPYIIDKGEAENFKNKKHTFERETETKKATFTTLITTYGVKHNEHYLTTVDQELTMDALF